MKLSVRAKGGRVMVVSGQGDQAVLCGYLRTARAAVRRACELCRSGREESRP